MKFILRIIKVNPLGNKEIKEIPLDGIEEILTPNDLFMVEFKLNEIRNLQFHLEVMK